MIITYILETSRGEFYCGKTIDLDRRLEEHRKERNGEWFTFNNRKEFQLILKIPGDYEKEIKRFGVQKFAKASLLLQLNVVELFQ